MTGGGLKVWNDIEAKNGYPIHRTVMGRKMGSRDGQHQHIHSPKMEHAINIRSLNASSILARSILFVVLLLLLVGCLPPQKKDCITEVEVKVLIAQEVGDSLHCQSVALYCIPLRDSVGSVIWKCVGIDTFLVQ